jgi:uncharacterized protein (DUF305 family)
MINLNKETSMNKMHRGITCVAAAVAFAAVAAPAAAQSAQHAQHGAGAAHDTQQHDNMSAHDMMKSMQEMHQKMASMPMSGNHDHDFAMMMRSHHQAGIDMAQAELKHGKDPQMKQAAKKIVADQTKEVKKFDAWLAKHPAPAK